MPITGKDACDSISSALQPMVGQSLSYNGVSYTLESAISVSGPYSTYCRVGRIWGNHPVIPAGGTGLIVRYTTQGGDRKVEPLADVRVLTGIELPDDVTTHDLVELGRAFLEAAR